MIQSSLLSPDPLLDKASCWYPLLKHSIQWIWGVGPKTRPSEKFAWTEGSVECRYVCGCMVCVYVYVCVSVHVRVLVLYVCDGMVVQTFEGEYVSITSCVRGLTLPRAIPTALRGELSLCMCACV